MLVWLRVSVAGTWQAWLPRLRSLQGSVDSLLFPAVLVLVRTVLSSGVSYSGDRAGHYVWGKKLCQSFLFSSIIEA